MERTGLSSRERGWGQVRMEDRLEIGTRVEYLWKKGKKRIIVSLFMERLLETMLYSIYVCNDLCTIGWGYILKTYIIVLMMYLKYNTEDVTKCIWFFKRLLCKLSAITLTLSKSTAHIKLIWINVKRKVFLTRSSAQSHNEGLVHLPVGISEENVREAALQHVLAQERRLLHDLSEWGLKGVVNCSIINALKKRGIKEDAAGLTSHCKEKKILS